MSEPSTRDYLDRVVKSILESSKAMSPGDPVFKQGAEKPQDPVSKEKQPAIKEAEPKQATNPVDDSFNKAFPGTTIKPPFDPKKTKTVKEMYDEAFQGGA